MDSTTLTAEAWINFLRTFSPQAQSTSLVDERCRRACETTQIPALTFTHPFQPRAIEYLNGPDSKNVNIVLLTGTAGDGKTRIAHEIWCQSGGDAKALLSNKNYFKQALPDGRVLHLVRDMSALKPDEDEDWRPEHLECLKFLCEVASRNERSKDVFLVATNDGQFMEAMQGLQKLYPDNISIENLRAKFEKLLLDETNGVASGYIRCINMSNQSSAEIFDLALAAILNHPGWNSCIANEDSGAFFGPNCYVRKNLEILKTDQFKSRLRSLILLCDRNDVHISVREILILLSNALLGNTAAQESSHGIPRFEEIPQIIRDGKSSCGSIYSNVLGGNLLGRSRRQHVYEALDRFQIGHETTNVIDTMLLFGQNDPEFQADYAELVGQDTFYGATVRFSTLQKKYLDADEATDTQKGFATELIEQRRRLFFTLPDGKEAKYPYWALTVFRHANEYIKDVLQPLDNNRHVNLGTLKKLVLGLNRIFTGLLVQEQDRICLATSGTYSQARVSRMIEDQLPVDDGSRGEVKIEQHNGKPYFVIYGQGGDWPKLQLTLTRFEFILRVADGALPSSFSKECFEDITSFKTQLLAFKAKLQQEAQTTSRQQTSTRFRILQITSDGGIREERIEMEGLSR
jgi:hypothetical protein